MLGRFYIDEISIRGIWYGRFHEWVSDLWVDIHSYSLVRMYWKGLDGR